MKIFILLTILTVPTIAFAQSNNYLVGVPGLDGENANFDTYINSLYALFIGVAALLAVVKIIIAGVKYMFSDVVPQKSQAKQDIKGALIGLVVVLSAVLILNVINPDLTGFNLDVERVESGPGGSDGARGATGGVNSGAARIIQFHNKNQPAEEKKDACENINQETCAKSKAYPGDNSHCYRGIYDPKKDTCNISDENNAREGEEIKCSRITNTKSRESTVSERNGTIQNNDIVTTETDCSKQISRCAEAGYSYKRMTSVLGTEKIECTNNLPATYSCKLQRPGVHDCSLAEARCRASADRTPSPSNTPDKINCS